MITALIHELTTLGFPEHVAAVYVFLAKKGEVSVREVGRECALARSTAYDVLMLLVGHGFVRVQTVGRFQRFVMQSPSLVRTALDARRREAEVMVERFSTVLPSLRALQSMATTVPMLQYGSGSEGIESAREECARLSGDIIQLFDYDAFLQCGKRDDLERYHDMMMNEGRSVRSIVMLQKRPVGWSQCHDGVRTVPGELFPLLGEMSVCADRVFLLAYAPECSAVIIHSRVIADVCRASLELAWRMAGEIEKWTTRV